MSLRYPALLLSGVLLVLAPAPAPAQWPLMMTPQTDPLAGNYVTPRGMNARVYVMGTGYLFVDEAGLQVPFVPVGADQLRSASVNGLPVPDIGVTASRNLSGRIILRFDAPGVTPAYWVSAP